MATTATFSQMSRTIEADFGEELVIGGGEGSFTTDETLSLINGVLSVNTADEVEQNNTLPVTSAAVHTTVGNIETLLSTI